MSTNPPLLWRQSQVAVKARQVAEGHGLPEEDVEKIVEVVSRKVQ
jgi:hypothetical protein